MERTAPAHGMQMLILPSPVPSRYDLNKRTERCRFADPRFENPKGGLTVPDVIACPFCNETVSRNTIECRLCGATINDVPAAVTAPLIASLRDDDLPDFLFRYASKVVEEQGGFRSVGPRQSEILAALPLGIGAAYSLVVLDSEVWNGGFYQWFTNSSGQIAYETLEALRLIGATPQVDLVQRAIQLNERLETKYRVYRNRWKPSESPHACATGDANAAFWADVESNFRPEFDRISSEFYSLENTASLWITFVKYFREHTDECVHLRG